MAAEGVVRAGRQAVSDALAAPPSRHAAVGVPLVGIAVSEGALYAGRVDVALWGHLATLLFCTLALLRLREEHAVLVAFALVPLFRLVNLGMPVFFELTVYWFPLIYGPMLPALWLLARERPAVEPPRVTDPRQLVALLPLALLASLLLAELEFAIIRPEGLVPSLSAVDLLVLTVVMVGFVGLVEELLFRGLLQRTLEVELGRWPGLLLASAVFGLMHSGYGLPAEVGFAAAIGLGFGLVYDWTDSLALVAFMHGMLNVFLFGVIPHGGSLLAG